MKGLNLIRILLLLLAVFSLERPAEGGPPPPPDSAAAKLVTHGGYAVEGGPDGKLLAMNSKQQFVPASTLKILTALASLNILGPEYRFETAFIQDEHGDLYIQGFGDPYLTSEEVAYVCGLMARYGLQKVRDLVLDASAFDLQTAADGAGDSDNPYDAMNSALAVNFNTVNVVVDDRGRVVSAEKQTPTLPLMQELAAHLPAGEHRLNITAAGPADREGMIGRYTGELFRAVLLEKGLAGEGRVRSGRYQGNLKPLYVHSSRWALKDLIRPLMRFSNNYIANQIFLACGVPDKQYPATWQKSRNAFKAYLEGEIKLGPDQIVVVEGAGLSRQNLATPEAMLAILQAFKPYAYMLPEVDGRFQKSGTLTGVYSYAGYFVRKRSLDSFVIFLNQPDNTRDELLALLTRARQ